MYINMSVFTIPILVFSFIVIQWLDSSLDSMHQLNLKSTAYTLKMEALLQEERVHYRDALLNIEDAAERDNALTALSAGQDDFKENFDLYAALVSTDDTTGAQLLSAAKTAYFDAYMPLLEQFVSAVRAGDEAQANTYLSQMLPHLSTVMDTMDAIVSHNGRHCVPQ
jgi:hypothetical protein